MARQSLTGRPKDDLIQLAKETLATIDDAYFEKDQLAQQRHQEWEALEAELAQDRADRESILGALFLLEGGPTADNDQDIPPPSTPHLVPVPVDEWVVEEGEEVEEVPEQPHTEPVDEPPPEAA